MDQLFNWISTNQTASITLLILVVFLAVLVMLIYLVAFIQDRPITFWPPAIGPKPVPKQQTELATYNTSGIASKSSSGSSHFIIIPKASSGYTFSLIESIKREVTCRFPKVSLEPLPSPKVEHAEEMAAHFNKAIEACPDAILITLPPGKDSLLSSSIKALKKGIPIITVDDSFPAEPFIAEGILPPVNISCNHTLSGELAAKLILNRLERKGNIAIISGPLISSPSQSRKLAFIDKIIKFTPNMKIVFVRETNWCRPEAKTIMMKIIEKEITVDAVFCCNDRLALGALDALKIIQDKQANWPILVGHDGISDIYDPIKEGYIFGTIDQHIEAQAKHVVNELSLIISNKIVYLKKHRARVVVPPTILTIETIEEINKY